jgi:hypothetical protein
MHAPLRSALLAGALALALAAAARDAAGAREQRRAAERRPAAAQPAPSPAAPEGSIAAETAGAPEPAETPLPPFELLGTAVAPGETRRLDFQGADSFTAGLVVLRGVAPGPALCVTAGVHGDELNGIAIARRLLDSTEAAKLRGTLVVVPIVNAHGFRQGTRYLPDRRDLNRHFPGSPRGSAASRIAHRFFEQVVRRCDALVDLHTGSLNRANLPQIRTDLREVDNLRLAWGFGTEHVVHRVGQPGTLRRAATDAGIPAVVYEAGEPQRIQPDEIERGVEGVRTLLTSLAMTPEAHAPGQADGAPPPVEQRIYHSTTWVRADAAGIYIPAVELGEPVEAGQKLADVTDPFSNQHSDITAPRAGRVLGMALGQVVIPGFALFHLGAESGPPPEETGTPLAERPADGNGLHAELADERPE